MEKTIKPQDRKGLCTACGHTFPREEMVELHNCTASPRKQAPAAPFSPETFAQALVSTTDEGMLVFTAPTDDPGANEHFQIPVKFFGPENLVDLRKLIASAVRRAMLPGKPLSAKVEIKWDLGEANEEALFVRTKRALVEGLKETVGIVRTPPEPRDMGTFKLRVDTSEVQAELDRIKAAIVEAEERHAQELAEARKQGQADILLLMASEIERAQGELRALAEQEGAASLSALGQAAVLGLVAAKIAEKAGG